MADHRSLLIWGAGQQGRVVAEMARLLGHTVLGYVDVDPDKLDAVVDAAGARVILTQAQLIACMRGHRVLPPNVDAIVPAIGDNRTRFAQLAWLGGMLCRPLIHPTAYVSASALILPGSVVSAMAVVNTAAHVGHGVIVNTSAIVGHDSIVGDAAHIAANVVLTGATHVGARAFIGTSASVIPGVRIGADAIVGAGAVVLHDVAAGSTAVGVPAHVIDKEHHGEADLSISAPFVWT